MFKLLKEKLRNWTKKISEKTETVEETQNQELSTEISKKEEIEDKEEVKEVQIPTKFEPGLQKYVPDTDKIKESEYKVFTDVEYALALEKGTSRIRPRKHFGNSLSRSKSEIREAILKQVRLALT